MAEVRLANLDDPADQAATIELLDMYCRDEFGDSAPLSDEARRNLIPGLKAHGGGKVFLAFANGDAVGLAICLVGFSSFRGRPLINIHDIAVRPESRGRGVGRALLAAISQEAERTGCCKVTLEVRSDNKRAQALYSSEGFVATEPQTWFWSKPITRPDTR
jgi:ribosomal protein S18 acetylase RimI-like enzyme